VGFANGYATCWKNGVAEQLTDNAKDNSFAWAVALKGGDVYVAGAIQLPLDSVYQTNYEAVYWKNGDPVIMNTVNGYANCIDVKGGDVYLGGFSPAAFQTVATYWKNGVRVAVKDTVSSSLAKGIAVSGNDVYLVGYIVNNQGTYMAAYWKNGVTNLLKSNSIATGIVIQGGDIYIAVTSYTVNSLEDGSYYKNGVSVSIEPEKSEMINSIAVQGNDVYLGGSSYNGATYWKNGRLTHLSSDRYSVVNGITVVQK
jgi:hypothetical protein